MDEKRHPPTGHVPTPAPPVLTKLGALVEKALSLVDARVAFQNVSVERNIAADLALKGVDTEDLVLLILSSLNHSLDVLRSRRQGRVLRVQCARSAPGRLSMEISDNGETVPHELCEQLRALSACPSTLADRGLKVLCVISEQGQHATSISLEDGVGTGVATPKSRRDADGPGAHAKWVLVVDDDVDLVDYLTEILSERGYKTDTANNGYEALVKVRTRPFDIILLDLKMPRVDGGVFMRTLATEHPALLDRAVVMSGCLEEYASLLRGRLTICLSKPFTREALFSALDTKLATADKDRHQPPAGTPPVS